LCTNAGCYNLYHMYESTLVNISKVDSAEISSVYLDCNAKGMFQRIHKNAENFSIPFGTNLTALSSVYSIYILLHLIVATICQGRNKVCGIRDQRGGIRDQKGGIWDHSPGIRDHRPWDRDRQFFLRDQGLGCAIFVGSGTKFGPTFGIKDQKFAFQVLFSVENTYLVVTLICFKQTTLNPGCIVTHPVVVSSSRLRARQQRFGRFDTFLNFFAAKTI